MQIRSLLEAIGMAALATISLSAAQSSDVIGLREWRTKNERQIIAELLQLVALASIASNKPDSIKNADALTAV